MQKIFLLIFIGAAGMISCSPARYFTKGQQVLSSDTALTGAHTGISIYDVVANKYLYNYQGDKYFVPASNTKLFTCYAAMKYLGDSLVGARYRLNNNVINIVPTGDPTFLHPDYENQPLLKLLQTQGDTIDFTFPNKVIKYGPGWSWDDYEDDYMPERSQMPVFGNLVWFYRQQQPIPKTFNLWLVDSSRDGFRIYPREVIHGSEIFLLPGDNFTIKRRQFDNSFYPERTTTIFKQKNVPFITEDNSVVLDILSSIVDKNYTTTFGKVPAHMITIHSQPTDSLLKPMMHRSDNFFAEQSLLMVSNEKLGYMNDEAIIDTVLKNDLKDLPQKPVWVDGSGLSRYNQFTPQDIITLLLKIKNEFGLERIRNILPKGNTGTLTNYYEKIGPAIFAKTGSLSGQIALSGYLVCKSKKLLLFSIMVNNHNSTGRGVRRAVEKFVTGIWERN